MLLEQFGFILNLWKPGQFINRSRFVSRAIQFDFILEMRGNWEIIICSYKFLLGTRNEVQPVFWRIGKLRTWKQISSFERHRHPDEAESHLYCAPDGDWKLHQPFDWPTDWEVPQRALLIVHFLLRIGDPGFRAHYLASRLLVNIGVLHGINGRKNFQANKEES